MGAALNDLAYAVNDTIKDPANFKALNVLIQEMINNAVMQALNSTFGTEEASPLDSIIQNIVDALQSKITTGGVPIVKSVQRGTTTSTSVTISSVDPNKCLVILDNQYTGDGGAYAVGGNSISRYYASKSTGGIVSSLAATKLTITANKASEVIYSSGDYEFQTATGKVSWQVIEFY